MSDRIKTIFYKGKEILWVDYSNLKGEEYIKIINEFRSKIDELVADGRSDIRCIVDGTNSETSPAVWKVQLDFAKYLKPYMNGMALLGVEGLKKFFLETGRKVNPKMRAFDTIEEAKEWLVNQ